jgi:two-component system chemotaxis sensor kinase CheA
MDELSSEEMSQILALFRGQTLEMLDEVEAALLAWGEGAACSGVSHCQCDALEVSHPKMDAVEKIRRVAHTIKGDAACVGLSEVAAAAHYMEDLIEEWVKGGKESRYLVDQLLGSLDEIRSLVQLGCNASRVRAEPAPSLSSGATRDLYQASARAGGDAYPVARVTSISPPFIRVASEYLDELLGLAEEMSVVRAQLESTYLDLASTAARSVTLGCDTSQGVTLNRVARQLQAAVALLGGVEARTRASALKMRMVALDRLFSKLGVAARRLALELGKQLRVELRGGETKLDQGLVELIYEPLLHLLRNAIAHGLEPPDERQMGKEAVGKVSIIAYGEGEHVVVEVSDDGRGIDVEALKLRAVQAGVISQAEAAEMTHERALELVFHPAISTADQLSLVSGRGIGCSAARKAVAELGGWIEVSSQPGVGTTFRLRVLRALAMIRALCFSCGSWLFALPLSSLSEVVQPCSDQLLSVGGISLLRLSDVMVPVFSLGSGGEAARCDTAVCNTYSVTLNGAPRLAVIAFSGKRRFGIWADDLVDISEVVVRPVKCHPLLGGGFCPDWIAGAGLVGDAVALVIDAGKLYRAARSRERRLVEERLTPFWR